MLLLNRLIAIPNPPRNTTLLLYISGLHANPNRGPKSRQVFGHCSLGFTSFPFANPFTGSLVGMKFVRWFFASVSGANNSQRSPRFTVRFGRSFQSFCTNPL